MILLRNPENGEQVLTDKLDGYDGWEVLSDDAPPPPSDDCEWCCEKGGWQVNKTAAKRRRRLDDVRNPERLLEIIDKLSARLDALEQGKRLS